MADKGPHSKECAEASSGTCHCDCHGTMHGIARMPGRKGHDAKHGAKVTVVPVKGAGGKVTHYKVTDAATGLPPGGGTPAERVAARAAQVKVTATSKRTPTFPPPVANWARKVRETLPKDRAGWDALIPRRESTRDRLLVELAEYEKRLAELQAERAQFVETLKANMKAAGLTPAQIRKGINSGKFLDLNRLDESLDFVQNTVNMYNHEISTASDVRDMEYPLDPSRTFKMPPAEMQRHLSRVLDVGGQALEAVRDELRRDDEHKRLRDELQLRRTAKRELDMLLVPKGDKLPVDEQNRRIAAVWDRLPDNGNSTPKLERAIRRRESEVIREMLAAHRSFGGVKHDKAKAGTDADAGASGGVGDGSKATGARNDWAERLAAGEGYFPDDWLRHSNEQPLTVITSQRAFYSKHRNELAMSHPDRDKAHYDGAFKDETDEVVVHELGHRMEQTVPGLTHLEFAFVRQRSTDEHGNLERPRTLADITGDAGYMNYETAFEDKWKRAYAGKTYEVRDNHPAGQSWEVFQVGLQDLYGRSSDRYGDEELQAFVLGALLTLA